jgi:hypothetical protein
LHIFASQTMLHATQKSIKTKIQRSKRQSVSTQIIEDGSSDEGSEWKEDSEDCKDAKEEIQKLYSVFQFCTTDN